MDRWVEEYVIGCVNVTNVLLGVAWALALICLGLMIW